jgi:hypothetical protein
MGDMPESMWSPAQVAEYLSVPRRTLDDWRTRGIGPKGARVGRHIRYRPTDVVAWFDAQLADDPRRVAV